MANLIVAIIGCVVGYVFGYSAGEDNGYYQALEELEERGYE